MSDNKSLQVFMQLAQLDKSAEHFRLVRSELNALHYLLH